MKFDRAAPDYARHAGPQAAVVEAMVRSLPCGDGIATLELGAGTGLLTRELVRLGYAVTATDLSPAMVGQGLRTVPGARWEPLDAWSPGVARCDRLFSANLLQWANDPVAVLRAHAAALMPGGVMRHAIFTKGTLGELRSVATSASPLAWRSGDEWECAIRAAGLRVSFREDYSVRHRYDDALALLRSLHGSGAVSGKAIYGPGALRGIIRAYDVRYPDSGGVFATWEAVILEARRSG